jgi:hypothetical protein
MTHRGTSSSSRRYADANTDRAVAARLAEEYEGPGAGVAYRQPPADIVRVMIRLTPERVLGYTAS